MVKKLGSSVQDTGKPQFRIMDLLVLITSLAVALAIQEGRIKTGLMNILQTDNLWFNSVSRTVFAATSGLPIAAIYLFLIRRFRGIASVQPGHWLLLSMLCMTISATVSLFLYAVVPDGFVFNLEVGQIHLLLSAFLSLVSVYILVWAGKQNSAAWRKVLFLFAFSFTLWPISCLVLIFFSPDGDVTGNPFYVLNAIDWVEAVLNVVIAVFLSVLAIVEFKNKIKRDLWHWLGVFVVLLGVTVVPMIGFAYSILGLWNTE